MNFDPKATRPVIFGCRGPELTSWERDFFGETRPFGFILFARNIACPAQVEALTASLRSTVPHHAPILIDQEGGRVARLKGELAHRLPPMAKFGELYERNRAAGLEAAALAGGLLAHDLGRLGIDVDCVPVLDVRTAGSHEVIGDRAFSTDPESVSALGRALAESLMAGGVLPVMKHIPGHGRAKADSHFELPAVDAKREELEVSDFSAFRALSDLPLAMTAHVVYSAIDPDQPATCSRSVIAEVIRGFIGFDGLLMSDDLSMKALAGGFAQRTAKSLSAGCDIVLHCNGEPAEMTAIIEADPQFRGAAAKRANDVLGMRRRAEFDAGAAWTKLCQLVPEPVA